MLGNVMLPMVAILGRFMLFAIEEVLGLDVVDGDVVVLGGIAGRQINKKKFYRDIL